ncbi:hypothetical protein C6Q17_37575 [Burkholderia contaminans]|nr:hypothetical protein C6Q17_37575 [Burkholderia contaminans]
MTLKKNFIGLTDLVRRVDAKLRLCWRYRKLAARGNGVNTRVTAVARELAEFIFTSADCPCPSPYEAKPDADASST